MPIETIKVLVHVEGRASARWRGAKSGGEAAELNQGLSTKRAFNVGLAIKRQIEAGIPGATAIMTGTLGPPADPKMIPVGVRGLGSKNPLIPEDKDGDHPSNRSAIVTLAFITSQLEPHSFWYDAHYLSLTQYWQMEVQKLESGGLGYANANLRIRLIGLNGKSRRYEAKLEGEGLDTPDFKNPKNHDKPFQPSMVAFHTGKPLGFEAFDDNQIILWKAKAGPGVKIPRTKLGVGVNFSVTTLKFKGLGGDSDSVMLDNEFGFGPALNGLIVRGTLKPIDPHPGNYYTSTDRQTVYRGRNDTFKRGLMVSFKTGESEMSPAVRAHVSEWALRWAQDVYSHLMTFRPKNFR